MENKSSNLLAGRKLRIVLAVGAILLAGAYFMSNPAAPKQWR